jgi:putative ABC transport system ATP-binding protein
VRASESPWKPPPTAGEVEVNADGAPPAPAGAVQAAPATVTDPTHPPAIEVRGIGRRHPRGEGWLIRDVSFAVHPGDRLAVLGPSGAGKTVLLRALAMLDPLDTGEIRWRGHPVRGGSVPSYRKQVIYLHQRPALLDGSVEDNLRHPFTLKAHHATKFDPGRVVELLGCLDRDATFLGKSSRDLSGGEGQIVALLRAVQLDPAVLLLDEPTASLDRATSRAVEGLLDRWLAAGHGGRALVWVSHDRDQARRVTGQALHLRAGRLEPEG